MLEREKKSSGWYEDLFNWLPWLTTLLSALAGALIILLLPLTFGPCIINRRTTFVKDRINTAQFMILKTQYQQLRPAIDSYHATETETNLGL